MQVVSFSDETAWDARSSRRGVTADDRWKFVAAAEPQKAR